MDHRENADSTDPALASDATERADAAEPADPIERIEPADPMDRIDPAEPIDRIDPAEPMDKIDPAEPMDLIDPPGGMARISSWTRAGHTDCLVRMPGILAAPLSGGHHACAVMNTERLTAAGPVPSQRPPPDAAERGP